MTRAKNLRFRDERVDGLHEWETMKIRVAQRHLAEYLSQYTTVALGSCRESSAG